jgi:hypothetical protein
VDSVLYDTKTQNMQFTCWRSAHEILLGESSYNFGCGYTYGTRFGHMLAVPPGKLKPVPEWRLKNKIMPNLQSLRI